IADGGGGAFGGPDVNKLSLAIHASSRSYRARGPLTAPSGRRPSLRRAVVTGAEALADAYPMVRSGSSMTAARVAVGPRDAMSVPGGARRPARATEVPMANSTFPRPGAALALAAILAGGASLTISACRGGAGKKVGGEVPGDVLRAFVSFPLP